MINEMLMVMANASPKELLIDELESAIKEYKENPTDDKLFGKVCFHAQLILSKALTETMGVDTAIKEVSETRKAVQFFSTPKN